MSEAGSEKGWGYPDISGTAARQEGKKTSLLPFAVVEVWRKAKGNHSLFFQHHIPLFFFSLENILMLVISSLETKELNETEETRSGKEAWEV